MYYAFSVFTIAKCLLLLCRRTYTYIRAYIFYCTLFTLHIWVRNSHTSAIKAYNILFRSFIINPKNQERRRNKNKKGTVINVNQLQSRSNFRGNAINMREHTNDHIYKVLGIFFVLMLTNILSFIFFS